MDDRDIVATITKLTEDERQLENAHVGAGLSDDERQRMHDIEVRLDQCWDLLAQRRARRNAGLDPDGAKVRPEAVVEHFQQ